LAQETRLQVFRLLVQQGPGGLPAGQIAEQLSISPATLSFHLKELTHAGLTQSRQDGRFVIYSADFKAMDGLLSFLTQNCCAGTPCGVESATCHPLSEKAPMSHRPYNILFLCTHNSARSILAEGLVNSLGKGQFKGYSAGSQPSGKVNPLALDTLQSLGIDTTGMESKSWDTYAMPDAPQMDFIITVCDNAAHEACPFWPGSPMTAHWGFPDPSLAEGDEAAKRTAFGKTAQAISHRLSLFLSLPHDSLDRLSLLNEVKALGEA